MALGEVGYGLMGVVGGLTAGVGCVRFWYNNGCIDTFEGGRGLNDKRSHARHTRTHRASGVAGGVMLDARCSINITLSAGSDPYPSPLQTSPL